MMRHLANLYERSPKDKEEFWREYDITEKKIAEESVKRPLSMMQIERMFGVAQTKLMRLL